MTKIIVAMSIERYSCAGKKMKILSRIINYILEGTNLMATFNETKQLAQDIKEVATALLEVVNAEDLKLDEIRDFITSLKNGSATADQINELSAILTQAKDIITEGRDKAVADLAETAALNAPTP